MVLIFALNDHVSNIHPVFVSSAIAELSIYYRYLIKEHYYLCLPMLIMGAGCAYISRSVSESEGTFLWPEFRELVSSCWSQSNKTS